MNLNRLSWPLTVLTGAALLASITACSSQIASNAALVTDSPSVTGSLAVTPAAEPGVTSYLCPFTDGDMLFQWTVSNGYLTGTYQSAAITGSAPQEQVTTTQGSLSGTISGSGITLTLSVVNQQWYGNINGSSVTVNIPQQDGTIQPATCSQSSVSSWNSAIGGLNGQASSDNNTALQQQAQASSIAASQQQEQKAQDDVSTLTQDANFSNDVSSVANDVQTTYNDLATTRSDAANGNGDQCLNASTTVYNDAATTVYNDVLTTVYNGAGTVASDISKVHGDIGTVQNDQAALQNSGLPATPSAAAAISAAQAAIASAISTVNADIDHANGDLDAAYQIANSVGSGTCAGDGPGASPAGVSHLKLGVDKEHNQCSRKVQQPHGPAPTSADRLSPATCPNDRHRPCCP